MGIWQAPAMAQKLAPQKAPYSVGHAIFICKPPFLLHGNLQDLLLISRQHRSEKHLELFRHSHAYTLVHNVYIMRLANWVSKELHTQQDNYIM